MKYSVNTLLKEYGFYKNNFIGMPYNLSHFSGSALVFTDQVPKKRH